MCQYFSAMKQVAKEAFDNNMHHNDTMKIIPKAYLSNRECSVQEAAYHILPELTLRRTFSAVCFVNTNHPQERVQVLIPEKKLSKLSEDSPNTFKKSNVEFNQYLI